MLISVFVKCDKLNFFISYVARLGGIEGKVASLLIENEVYLVTFIMENMLLCVRDAV